MFYFPPMSGLQSCGMVPGHRKEGTRSSGIRLTVQPAAPGPHALGRANPSVCARQGFPARPDVSCTPRRGVRAPQPRRLRTRASRLHSSSARTAPRSGYQRPASGPDPRGSGEAEEARGPAWSGERPLGRERAPAPRSGNPGRDNSGSSGREARSHLPETRRTARRRAAQPDPAGTGSAGPSAPARSARAAAGGGRGGRGALTALPSPPLRSPPRPPCRPAGGRVGGTRWCLAVLQEAGSRHFHFPLGRGLLQTVLAFPCWNPLLCGRGSHITGLEMTAFRDPALGLRNYPHG